MTTPNHQPVASNEFTPEETRLYSVEKVAEWRSRQYGTLAGLREAAPAGDTGYVDTFNSTIDEQLKDFLREQGVDESSDHYADIYNLYRDAAVDRVSELEWDASAEARGDSASSAPAYYYVVENKIRQKLEQSGGNSADSPEDDHSADPAETADSDTQPDERREQLRLDLEAARDKWATASAKRSSKLFGRKKDEDDKIEADYHAAVQAYGADRLHDELANDDLDDEQKNLAVVSYLFDEQEVLREQITEKLNGTKVGKFVNWMNTGSKWQRVGKGVAVGFGAGIVGSVLAGAAGAGIIAAGTVAAAKFARGYARHDQRGVLSADEQFDAGAVSEAITDERAGLADNERADRFEDANRHFSYLLEDQTKDQQKKRRKAFAWGAGSVAVGSALGYGTFWLGSQVSNNILHGPDFQLIHPFGHHDYINGDVRDVDVDGPDTDVPSPNSPHIHDLDGDGIPNHIDPDIDGDGVNNAHDAHPWHPSDHAAAGDAGLDWSDLDSDARLVEYSEGGFQTLQEMDVPEAKWETIWEDAGTKLAQEGKTYRMDDGRWGWARPMRLSNHDLDIFAAAARHHGVTL